MYYMQKKVEIVNPNDPEDIYDVVIKWREWHNERSMNDRELESWIMLYDEDIPEWMTFSVVEVVFCNLFLV